MKRLFALIMSFMLLFALFASCAKPLEKLSAAELLDFGEKFLLEQDYKQAVVYFESLIEIEPKSARGYIGLAKAYAGLEQREDAIAVLQRGLEALPDDPDIRRMLEELGAVSPEPAEEKPIEAPAEPEIPAGDMAEPEAVSQEPVEAPAGAPAEAPAEPEIPAGDLAEPALWDENDFVINGVSVFDGTLEDLMETLSLGDREYRLDVKEDNDGRTFTIFELYRKFDNEDYYNNDYKISVSALYMNDKKRFRSVGTSEPGHTGIKGITVGETTVEEAMAIFPLPDKPIIDSYGNIEGYESRTGARGFRYVWYDNPEYGFCDLYFEKDYGMVYAINFNHELVVKAIYFYRPYND